MRLIRGRLIRGRLIAGLALLGAVAAFARGRKVGARKPRGARRIIRISRVVADLDRAEDFYRDALGFERVAAGRMDPALAAVLLPGASATVRRMRLNAEEIDLVRWDHLGKSWPAEPYPAGARADDIRFQHMAIVVDDMAEAFAHLSEFDPAPISGTDPVTLPGGVQAWKFRDPDGHPLELIFFPPGKGRPVWQGEMPGPFLGIDHSAISVGDTGRSLAFYRSLGFRRTEQTLNHGRTQAALDGFPGATARVSGLRLREGGGPGLELLGYQPPGRPEPPAPPSAVVTDWVTLDTGPGRPRALRDPDGHLLVFTG